MSDIKGYQLFTNPETYAAIFGFGSNPGKPVSGSRLIYPLWGRHGFSIGSILELSIPSSPSVKVKVLNFYSPLKWNLLMRSNPSGPMRIVSSTTYEPPTHGCILEFI
jgi:hypothetical protein